MKTKILADFQICIGVPLTDKIQNLPKSYVRFFHLVALLKIVLFDDWGLFLK